ncbi:Homocysteine S-methyltransferase [Sodiomyces alkalinus F11]|uniref:Homocysteine S-methyltransferase n=1 Tax=Sodiomyces alkalinus (strain CBS 110278 / VKM F-3762 / F11) TaxID=1314773 RepID=A0A3N2PRV0_SODAK|nr:Homocysteine S-methyltransferase [Sodiomyces alkalinus F11]ROT37096.1 Homocysteine S-methyltransferase [Sodiomyces alkalinus F11]
MTVTSASSSSPDSVAVLLLDGGLGTSLADDYGVRFGPHTPLWSSHLLIADQTTLLACQRDFAEVPVDIISTATYQVSLQGFANTVTSRFPNGIGRGDIIPFIRDAVRIAEDAAGSTGARVALSLGPYGACMVPSQEYSGRYDEQHDSVDALRGWHVDCLGLFQEAGVFSSPVAGYVALETVPRVDEIVALRQALDETRAVAFGTPFWISCLFPREEEGKEFTLPDGSSVKEAVAAMLDVSLRTLISSYERAVAELLAAEQIDAAPPALILYPDGTNGEVYNTSTQTWELPEGTGQRDISWETQLAQIVRETRSRGRWRQIVVGGCCKAGHRELGRLCRELQQQGLRG